MACQTADETLCDCGRETRVTHTYREKDKIIRRRKCDHCKTTFKTESPAALPERRIAES